MLFDEAAVKANLRNREGKRVFYLGSGDTLTPSARDYLHRNRVEIIPASQAKPQRYRLLGGGFVEQKPEYMTHLHGDVLVSKTHPRIRFRGAMDSLQAQLLWCCRYVQGDTAGALEQLLSRAAKIIACEVMGEPLPDEPLWGLDEKQLRERSHRPQDFYGQPHFMPQRADSEAVLALNRCRCACREAELAAAQAFVTEQGAQRQDLLQALNRMSSLLYILMIREKANRKDGK